MTITYSGISINPHHLAAPSPLDIAVAMGRICRWAGARWFTLGAHSMAVGVFAIERGADIPTWAWAFLHDAHEVITGEITSPWKTPDMKTGQAVLDQVIVDKYLGELQKIIDKALVKAVDVEALFAEAKALNVPGFEMAWLQRTGVIKYDAPLPERVGVIKLLAKSIFCNPTDCLSVNGKSTTYLRGILERILKGDLEDAFKWFGQAMFSIAGMEDHWKPENGRKI